MKTYPSITKKTDENIDIYAFDKIDGSNIRAEWTNKLGFHRFGSRHQLLDETHEFLHEAPGLVVGKYERDLTDIFKKLGYQKVICFFEFVGENSFAGFHKPEKHDVVLFDVNPYKKGILAPNEFVKHYGHLDIPKIVHQGRVGKSFHDNVRNSLVEGVTFEGVVCKGKRKNQTHMFKIKTDAWLNKLRNFCKEDDALFERLV